LILPDNLISLPLGLDSHLDAAAMGINFVTRSSEPPVLTSHLTKDIAPIFVAANIPFIIWGDNAMLYYGVAVRSRFSSGVEFSLDDLAISSENLDEAERLLRSHGFHFLFGSRGGTGGFQVIDDTCRRLLL
jgi:hypothetical protein